MTFQRQSLGKSGEDLACQFLLNKGYILIGRNVRLKFGEIDLLMKDGKTLVIVEVKTKKTGSFTLPQEKVDREKQKKLVRLAKAVWQKFPDWKIRIDVVAVDETTKKLDHIISAVEED